MIILQFPPKLGIDFKTLALWFLLALVILSGLTACSTPQQRFAAEAEQMGFQRQVRVIDLPLVIFKKGNPDNRLPLHVYLDGDGTPWIHNTRVSKDPTPRNTLVLNLMKLDPSPAIYLGRPCYHGFSEQQPCNPLLWTHQRYSERVVASMATVLKEILSQIAPSYLVLIGYSGGGTLVMLLAERFPHTCMVVTVAANLSVNDWASIHGYSPLAGSLDPAARLPLNPNIIQLHLAGKKDQNIPAHLIQKVVDRQSNAEFLLYENQDHSCCWEELWPSILTKLAGYPGVCGERRNRG